MNSQTEKMLETLAGKLGVSVQYLWWVMVRGNKVEGYILLSFIVLGLLVSLIGFLAVRYAWSREGSHDDVIENGGLTAFVIGFIPLVLFSYWCVMDLAMPEYGAMTDILSKIK
jgi:hypothetical protein